MSLSYSENMGLDFRNIKTKEKQPKERLRSGWNKVRENVTQKE
jgi:hypothetical protein